MTRYHDVEVKQQSAVSAYTRTLVGTTHSPSERGKPCSVKFISWKNIKMYMHMILRNVFPGNSIFVSTFDVDWLLCIMSKASKRKRFQHSCRKEFQWLRYDEAQKCDMVREFTDGAKKREFKRPQSEYFSPRALGVFSFRKVM